MSKKMY